MEQKKVVYCANCGERGHVYRECTGPITSFGIIAFKVVRDPREEEYDLNDSLKEIVNTLKTQAQFREPSSSKASQMLLANYHDHDRDHRGVSNFYYWNYWTIDKNVNWNYNLNTTLLELHPQHPPQQQSLLNYSGHSKFPKIKFLLIQRKDTMGYIDFIRGKYPSSEPEKSQALKVYLEEMTISERESLLTKTFDKIWDEIWNNKNSKIYKNEYSTAKEKFEKLDIFSLLENSESKWTTTEFGIPKGRRCIKEQILACAEREFYEETGYSKEHYQYLSNYPTVIEEFEGTNGVRYRHIYYLVKMKESAPPPKVDINNLLQTGEVQNIGWFTNDETQLILRPYDIEKKKVIDKVHKDLLRMNFKFNVSNNYHYRRKN